MVGRMPAPLRTVAARGCRRHAGVRTDLERIRVAPMSLNGSQRRDQRRRLVVSWNRSNTGDTATAVSDTRPMAAYGPEAHPEKQKGPATLLPTGAGGLALAAVPRHPDLGFMGSKSLECNGQELIEYMAAGIY